MHRQLDEALQVLQELRGCLERLASLSIDSVYVSLTEKRKYMDYGEYSCPMLQFCDLVHIMGRVLPRSLRYSLQGCR